jgi:segregation and condensation protein B
MRLVFYLMELTAIVESLLFATQEPLPLTQMVTAVKDTARDIKDTAEEGALAPEWVTELLTIDELNVRSAIDSLVAHYEADGRAFTIVERPHGWRLCAKAEYSEWCRALFPGKKIQRLSQPALETLAIIAYRQPITRADLPGKPILYGTTEAFLEHFAVRTLDELPNATELRRVKLPTPDSEQPGSANTETQLSLEPVSLPTPESAE